MTYSSLCFRVTGVSPLIMRAATLADPLHPLTRKLNEIARKRLKTDADHEKISQIECYGSLWMEDGRLVALFPDYTGADYDQIARDLGDVSQLIGVENLLAFKGNVRRVRGPSTTSDQHVIGGY